MLFPYPEIHEMILSPNGNILTCPDCGRQVQLEPWQVLVKGDQLAAHHYGLEINVTVQQPPRLTP